MDLSDINAPAFMMAFGIVLLAAYFHYRHRNVPPGPRGLPFLGYAPFFGPHPQDKFLELRKKYGNVMSLYMGPKMAIVLNDYEAIRAAFTGQAETFAGRPDAFVFRYISTLEDGKVHGIGILEGEIWKTERRFMLQTFRDLGMGKSAIQNRILEEAKYLTDKFASHNGQSFDPFRSFQSSVANVICILSFGRRFDHADPTFHEILAGLESTTKSLSQAGPMQSYPFLRFLPGTMRTAWKTLVTTFAQNLEFRRDMVKEHRNTYVETETRDYIDAFLHQQNKEASSSTGIKPAFQDGELLVNLGAFFGAGTETTTVTMQWSLLFMLHHPEVQERIQKELDENIARDTSVTVEDRVKLPYLEATVREIQRLANVTPFGVLRSNIEETTLLGYRIPKRCFIMANFKAANIDPDLWDNPLAFKPERFLNSDGKLFEPPQFMPFSIGKRACVGESLARMEIFLFFANILQRFQIRAPKESSPPPTTEYTTGISCRPLPFLIEAVSRR